jgi:glycerol-3-phosphate cytidylyltransferase
MPDIRFLGDDYVGKKFTGDDLGIELYYHKRSEHNFSTTNLRKIVYEKEQLKYKKI